jgi:adenylate cyclase
VSVSEVKTSSRSRFQLGRRLSVALFLSALASTLTLLAWPPERFSNKSVYSALRPIHNLELSGYDVMLAIRGEQLDQIDPRIRVVGVDFSDEQALGGWPFRRQYQASMIRNLARDGAKVIAVDFLFDLPTNPTDDKDLDAALKEAGNVVLTERIDYGTNFEVRTTLNDPYHNDSGTIDFEEKAMAGFANIPKDYDGTVRTFVPVQYFQDDLHPSFSLAAYLRLMGLTVKDVRLTDKRLFVGNLAIPLTGPTGRELWTHKPIPSIRMDYPAGGNAFPMDAKFSQVATGTFPPGTFKDKIVFVGLVGSQLLKQQGEAFVSAFSRYLPSASAGKTDTSELPGVVLQALHFNSLLKHTYLRETTPSSVWSLTFLVSLTGITIARKNPNILGLFAVLLCGGIFFAFSFLCLKFSHLHVPWVIPNVTMLACAAGVGWLESGSIKKKWAGYVSPAVLNQILQSEEGITAKRYDATVMFGDIRGFTSFSERHSPEAVVYLLNRHLEKMTQAIMSESGTIDKFLGDGILAVFGAPITYKDSAVKAVRAACKMQALAMEPILDEQEQPHILATGFGITTGSFLGSDVGSRQLRNWTIIGDTVNLASRLQGVTGEPDVIIDLPTYEAVRKHVEVVSLGAVSLKGKAQPVECFKVIEWRDAPVADRVL